MINKLINKFGSNVHARELLTKSASAFIFKIAGIVVSYIFTLLVSRKYGVDAWGTFTLFFAIIQVLSKIARFGFDKGAVLFIAEYRVEKNWTAMGKFYFLMLSIVLCFNLLFSLVLFYFSYDIAILVFKKESAKLYVEIAALCLIPFSFTMINAASLKALKNIKEGVILGHTMLFALAIVGLFLLGDDIDKSLYGIYALTFSIYLGCLISFFLWMRKSKITLFNKEDSVKIKHIMKTTFPFAFAGALFLLMGWVDTFMLAYFKSEQEVGEYNIILKISRLSIVIILAVDSIFSSKISEFFLKKDYQGLEKLAIYGSKLSFFLTLPILLAICLFPNFILGIFHDSLQDELIVYALIIAVATKFVNTICGNVSPILLLTGKQVTFQNIILVSLVVNVIFNYLLIPSYGILGASISAFISVSLNDLLGLFFVKRYHGINASFVQVIFSKRNRKP